MKSYFTIKIGIDGQFYFNLKAPNNESILQSEGYKLKDGVLNGIKSVQINSQNRNNFEVRNSKKNEPYFVLKAQNGEIIGKSEMYGSLQAMENGIKSVIENGKTDKIKDLSHDADDDFLIIVNGREKKWLKKTINFEEVVELAFGKFENSVNVCYTVTYSGGFHNKPSGSLVLGQEIFVKSKMIFNVTATDKS